jgi:hypothetical protein
VFIFLVSLSLVSKIIFPWEMVGLTERRPGDAGGCRKMYPLASVLPMEDEVSSIDNLNMALCCQLFYAF